MSVCMRVCTPGGAGAMGDVGSKGICELKSCKKVVSGTAMSHEEGPVFCARFFFFFVSVFPVSFPAPFPCTYIFLLPT